MSIRQEAVSSAKARGLCTQCLKHKAAMHRFQCQRCIDTNKNKRLRAKERYRGYVSKNDERRRQLKAKDMTPEQRAKQREYQDRYEAKKKALKLGLKPAPNKSRKGVPLSEEHRRKISEGRAKAMAKRDTGEKKSYQKDMYVSEHIMQMMVNELEMFMAKLPNMTANDYLEQRSILIKNILLRGR